MISVDRNDLLIVGIGLKKDNELNISTLNDAFSIRIESEKLIFEHGITILEKISFNNETELINYVKERFNPSD